LTARVKAILRRMDKLASAPPASEAILEAGPLRIDNQCRAVYLEGKAVELTAKEFDLLLFFAQNPGRVYSREHLLDRVWGYSHSGYEHTVNSHINRLRAKIERDPSDPQLVQTVWGVGYKFNEQLARAKDEG
jgi:DNA-binding response OmpR family regulator